MPIEPLLTQKQISDYFQIPAGTLDSCRNRGAGPRCFKISSNLARYRRADVQAWVNACANTPTISRDDHE